MLSQLKAFLLLIVLVQCTQNQAQTERSIMKSTTPSIEYYIGSERHNWTISPQLKPDRTTVPCGLAGTTIRFISDIDTAEFNVKQNDTIQFYILLGKDSALTEIVGVPKNVNFTASYIQAHKGKDEVVVPEVHELANILVALSKVGRIDSNMVEMRTRYHKEVMRYFEPYQNHPVLSIINEHITKPLDNESYIYYYALKMNACAYHFDKDHIINDGPILKMGFEQSEDPIVMNKKMLEDFAAKSDFRTFYKKHLPYYDSLIEVYRKMNPIDKMQGWLEKKFQKTYGNYIVTFSPLVNGAHSTNMFADNGFEQTVMFVCPAKNNPKYNANVNEMFQSRVVFTEIDHNFVNPVSNEFYDEIEEIFSDRTRWVDGKNMSSFYSNGYSVFNEYMTWAVFSLYCMDTFPEKDRDIFIPKMEKQMVERRGFKKFKEFNQELMHVYKNHPAASIKEIYKKMLAWSTTAP